MSPANPGSGGGVKGATKGPVLGAPKGGVRGGRFGLLDPMENQRVRFSAMLYRVVRDLESCFS